MTRRAMSRHLHLTVAMATCLAGAAMADDSPLGWRLVWHDDFNELDETLWERESTDRPTNNSQHAYLPEQATVAEGRLIITSENIPAHGLPYRSGCVKSRRAQRYGRWEVRAKLPATRGMWPALWLLPDAPWPTQGEIDVMENRGNQPTLTSSAFHWGTRRPYSHEFHAVEQRMAVAGKLVNYHEDFHTFAVDWLPDQIRFYVDDVQHAVFYSDECGDFFPKLTAPMKLVINTAIGGDFLPPPDETTAWPQRFLVDWVRVYEAAPGEFQFANGDFETRGGSLAGWHVFGNGALGIPNVAVDRGAVHGGNMALVVGGPGDGDDNYSGVSQGVTAAGGEQFAARLFVQTRSDDGLAGTDNRAVAKIEFYNNRGDYFGGPAMLGVEEVVIADAATPPDEWHTRELAATAPEGAVEARLSIVFNQKQNAPGRIFVDDVTLTREPK